MDPRPINCRVGKEIPTDKLKYLSDTELSLFLLSVLGLIGGVLVVGVLIYRMIQNARLDYRAEAEWRANQHAEQLRLAREHREYLTDNRDLGLDESDLDLPREAIVARIAAATEIHRHVMEGLSGQRPGR